MLAFPAFAHVLRGLSTWQYSSEKLAGAEKIHGESPWAARTSITEILDLTRMFRVSNHMPPQECQLSEISASTTAFETFSGKHPHSIRLSSVQINILVALLMHPWLLPGPTSLSLCKGLQRLDE